MSVVPVLETERLRLRAHTVDDFPAVLAMWSNPDVTRYMGPPMTETRAWTNLSMVAGQWTLLGFGFWAVEERSTGRFAGECGFHDLKRPLGDRMRDVPEAGWVFDVHAQGRGYASEAMAAAIAWGDTTFASARTVCLINNENAASFRVAKKCGYVEFERTTYLDTPIALFERIRP
jgi:RimJ/RimL family protein N-acetyltransferase